MDELQNIQNLIYVIRGQRVMLDRSEGLIGGPFSLSRDKILPSSLLLSFRSHPVATTQRRFRLNFWNLGRIAVPLHRQSDKTSSGRRKQEN